MFRREALEMTGYYDEPLFCGGKELGFAPGILGANREIRYVPLLHMGSRGPLHDRLDSRHALLIQNRCWIALRHLSLPAALGLLLRRLVMPGFRSGRHGCLHHYATGLASQIGALPPIWWGRDVISPETQVRLRRIRRQRRGLRRA